MTRIKRSLFGGAMQAFLPDGATDARQEIESRHAFDADLLPSSSAIRLVPNNQEVFMHAQSDQSLIVEILERVDQVAEENAIK